VGPAHDPEGPLCYTAFIRTIDRAAPIEARVMLMTERAPPQLASRDRADCQAGWCVSVAAGKGHVRASKRSGQACKRRAKHARRICAGYRNYRSLFQGMPFGPPAKASASERLIRTIQANDALETVRVTVKPRVASHLVQ